MAERWIGLGAALLVIAFALGTSAALVTVSVLSDLTAPQRAGCGVHTDGTDAADYARPD